MMTSECTGCTWYQRGKDTDPDGEWVEWEFCEYHDDLIEYIKNCKDKEEED